MTLYEEYQIAEQTVINSFREILPTGIDLVTEFQTRKGSRVDMVIANGFEILAVVEIKAHTMTEVVLESAQKQVLRYQKELNCQWAIVTNGKRYFAHAQNEEGKKFKEIESVKELIKLIVTDNKSTKKHVNTIQEYLDTELWSHFIEELYENFQGKVSTLENLISVLKSITSLNCKVSATEYSFNHDIEDQIFQALLGKYDEQKLVRYVPFVSVYRLIKDQTIGMVSLVGMNDTSECYYADKYISESEDTSVSILPAENTLLNNTFILSCNNHSMLDNLTLWRLYGNNCKGACLTFEVDNTRLAEDNSFMLAPVSYGQSDTEHSELDLVKYMQTKTIAGKKIRFDTWCYWKHFFKHYRYAVECEVRLLYTGKGCGRRDWILTSDTEIPCPISLFEIKSMPNRSNDFPLTLRDVMLGSKCTDTGTKKRQLEELIKELNKGYAQNFSKVEISKIDNYR